MSAMTDKELAEEVARVWVNGGGEGSKRMTGDIQIMMSSRRTIMDGEVVTFATSFNRRDGVFGAVYEAEGPFRVSASRDAVVVHRASCASKQESAALLEAIICAESVRTALAPHQSSGQIFSTAFCRAILRPRPVSKFSGLAQADSPVTV